jgi:hypothetical protein
MAASPRNHPTPSVTMSMVSEGVYVPSPWAITEPFHWHSHRQAKRRRHHGVRLKELLALCAACLVLGFVGNIVAEALDADPDLYPVGAESFTNPAHASPVLITQLVAMWARLHLTLQWFVMAAGTLLVLSHRARSALASPGPFPCVGLCSRSRRQIAPSLGHTLFQEPSALSRRARSRYPMPLRDRAVRALVGGGGECISTGRTEGLEPRTV